MQVEWRCEVMQVEWSMVLCAEHRGVRGDLGCIECLRAKLAAVEAELASTEAERVRLVTEVLPRVRELEAERKMLAGTVAFQETAIRNQGEACSDLSKRVKEAEDSERLALRNNEALRAALAAPEDAPPPLTKDTKILKAAKALMSRHDFWQQAGTLPGEYDNLADILAAHQEDAPPAPRGECPECDGEGEYYEQGSLATTPIPCPRCGGTGVGP